MESPEAVHEATRAFLAEYPDAEPALDGLLDRDDPGASWAFDDVSLDSGRFGELVSRDFVEQTDDGYRFRHPEAVRTALDGEETERVGSERSGSSRVSEFITASVDRRELAGLCVALAIAAGARLLAYGSVFRDGHVVSPGNDPYYYRYWQAQLLERSDGLTDLGVLADMGGANSRPFTHAVNWWLTELLGGTAGAADTVAAWLPVVAAVALGVVLYALTKLLSGDVRAGLAAVVFLGVAPVHVVYTNVGFLEHRLHQYLWLGILALALAWLAVDVRRRHEQRSDGHIGSHARSAMAWIGAVVVAVAVAASAHIWTGAPLTFVPVALYVALRVPADVQADINAAVSNAPLLAGLAGGSMLAAGLHLGFGWQDAIGAFTPLLVAGGAVAVTALGELWRRVDLSVSGLLAAEGLAAAGWTVLFWLLRPGDIGRLVGRVDELFFREGATETTSLFAAKHAFVLGPLWQLGTSFYLGLAVLLVATGLAARRYRPGWLVVACFGWYYLVLAAFQVRFAAQLTFFISVCAGVACVYLLAKVDLARPIRPFDSSEDSDAGPVFSVPGGSRAGYLVGTLALLLVFNLVFVPSLVGQTTFGDEQFEAAMAINDHADAVDREYPASAVETDWANIRMYNYFVNGESSSYDSRYEEFLAASNPDERYDGLRQGGTYVVLDNQTGASGPTYEILYRGLGVGHNDVNSTAGRFRPVYIGDNVRAFTAVEGARINVTGGNNREITARTNVEIAGDEMSYARTGVVSDGTATIRVAHPGEYVVDGETVTVTSDAVYEGSKVTVTRG